MDKTRCSWVNDDPLYIKYHDEEWGIPIYDDQQLFELLSLEGAQAGLSWITILKRRLGYREAFANFDIEKVSQFDEAKVQELLCNEYIIRHELKIRSVIKNAQAIKAIKVEYGSFSSFVWGFVDHTPIINNWSHHEEVPAYTEESTRMSKALKKYGFSFVGPTICYAFMQVAGLVNDHTKACYLYQQVGRTGIK
ncbi:DNA-3-methyladenine glycosylase I [Virgibacillus soli]|uniref:DNA-3-methyladenine glycosylase I n=1 Tax=Paracerasibacillus soli TaxID=480284 RepID=UPI0035E5A31B